MLYSARCVCLMPEIDLALVKIFDKDCEAFYENTVALPIGKTPNVEDVVQAYGFPVGGTEMSVTRGVVSRLEMIPVAISPNHHVFSVDMDC